jgi:hypothetical protein
MRETFGEWVVQAGSPEDGGVARGNRTPLTGKTCSSFRSRRNADHRATREALSAEFAGRPRHTSTAYAVFKGRGHMNGNVSEMMDRRAHRRRPTT